MNSKNTGVISGLVSEARTSTGSAGGGGLVRCEHCGKTEDTTGADPQLLAAHLDFHAAKLCRETAEPLPFFSPFELFARALPFWTRAELLAVAAILSIPLDR